VDAADHERVRRFATRLLLSPMATPADVAEGWRVAAVG
jgi:hypothetical protein